MHAAQRRLALQRLRVHPEASRTTRAAARLLAEVRTEASLCRALDAGASTPAALEALCALRCQRPTTYRALQRIVDESDCFRWSLVESLNRYPCYSAMRAFLAGRDQLGESTVTLPFFMLARNRVFFPADMQGSVYAYYHGGFTKLVEAARRDAWNHLHPAALAVLELIHTHLKRSEADLFVLYLGALLLGGLGPHDRLQHALRRRLQETGHSLIRRTARRVLRGLVRGGHLQGYGSAALGA